VDPVTLTKQLRMEIGTSLQASSSNPARTTSTRFFTCASVRTPLCRSLVLRSNLLEAKLSVASNGRLTVETKGSEGLEDNEGEILGFIVGILLVEGESDGDELGMPETDGVKLGKALGSGDGSALEGIELGSLDGLLEGFNEG